LETSWGEDREDEWKFVFGEAHLDGLSLGFAEFDLDLERELFLDAWELLDWEREEPGDLEPDFAEWCERTGDCETFLVSTGSSEWDLERDLDTLLLPFAGETDPLGEGDLE